MLKFLTTLGAIPTLRLGCFVLIVSCAGIALSQDGEISINAIEQRWLEREAQFATIDISWRESEVRRRPQEAPKDPFSTNENAPSTLHRHSYERRLVLSGNQARFEDNAPQWYLSAGGYSTAKTIEVDDGVVSKTLTKHSVPDTFPLQGVIQAQGQVSKNLHSLNDLQALFDHYRPSVRLMPLIRRGIVSQRTVQINDRECIIVLVRRQSGKRWFDISYSLDPQLGFAVRRIVQEVDAKVVGQHDREYVVNAESGLLLQSWKMTTLLSTGELDREIEATINEQKINGTVSPDTFTLSFPPTTLITKVAGGEGTHAIQRTDGSTRSVSRSELSHLTPKQIIARENPGYSLLLWMTVLLALGGVLFGILVLRRRVGRSLHCS